MTTLDAALIGVMRRLARTGRGLAIDAATGIGTIHATDGGGDGTTIAAPLAAQLRDDGLVEACGSSYRLSAAGKRALRRALSAGDGRGVAETVLPRCEFRPGAPVVNVAESPLSWLRSRKDRDGRPLLSDAQFAAGERLRQDLYFAHLTPRVTAAYGAPASSSGRRRSAPGHFVDEADHVIAAKERVRRALAAVGSELSGILIDLCGHLIGLEVAEARAGWPRRSGKVVLDLALTRLARHYGYLKESRGGSPSPRPMTRWGAQGYEGDIDAWS